jgi:GNAT superfamily N-acetyltransferase
LAENKYVYRTLAEGDEDGVRELLKRNFIWTDWEWKYLHNPSFDPSLVVVAEENGEIVGCDHWLPRDIKLSSSSVGRVIFCADIVVDSNHRGRGIGESLVRFLRKSSLSNVRGAVLSYAFTSLELNERLFQPTAGSVPLATSTVTYCKRWSWKQFIRRVEEVNMKTDPKGNLKFVFHVLGAPPLTIALNQGRIEAFQGDIEGAAVRIKSDLATLGHLKRKERRMRKLVKALLTGRLRVSGSLSGIIHLYQNLHLLEEVFRIAL